MEVHLTEDQRAFVREAIQAGRFVTEEDALQEALLLWETRERRRAEILAAVDQAESSVARGEGRRITTPEEALGGRVVGTPVLAQASQPIVEPARPVEAPAGSPSV